MKPLAEFILAPSGLITLLVVAAGILYWLPRWRRFAGYAITAAALIYMVFGSGLAAFWLMSRLEYEFPPEQDGKSASAPDTMVVLAGYALPDSRIPITGYVNSASGFRVLEASRIFARTRRMNVITSGNGEVPAIMRDLLVELGIPRTVIHVDQDSVNTYESAVHLRERLSGRRFYLVTSAGHMPRALRVFRRQGLLPVPAPTDYLASATLRDSSLVPSGTHLAISDLAVHEYLGLMWYRLLGRI
jgi:uncharacterized SAM-binding protein YcdF (DUF218 family)